MSFEHGYEKTLDWEGSAHGGCQSSYLPKISGKKIDTSSRITASISGANNPNQKAQIGTDTDHSIGHKILAKLKEFEDNA